MVPPDGARASASADRPARLPVGRTARLPILSLHVSFAVVAVTGVVYGWMSYLLTADDPFAVVNHPWQPMMQKLHVLSAPMLVFAAGWLLGLHVLPRLRVRQREGRLSGLVLAWSLAPMVVSGYLLQVSVEERLGTLLVWLHVGTSLLWIAVLPVHVASGLRKSAAARRQASERTRVPVS